MTCVVAGVQRPVMLANVHWVMVRGSVMAETRLIVPTRIIVCFFYTQTSASRPTCTLHVEQREMETTKVGLTLLAAGVVVPFAIVEIVGIVILVVGPFVVVEIEVVNDGFFLGLCM